MKFWYLSHMPEMNFQISLHIEQSHRSLPFLHTQSRDVDEG